MSTLSDVLTVLAAREIDVQAHGNRLRCSPPERVTPDVAGLLREHKAALLDLIQIQRPGMQASLRALRDLSRKEADLLICRALAAGENDHAERLQEAWEERVAICMKDGKLDRYAAERIALRQLRTMQLEFEEERRKRPDYLPPDATDIPF